MFLHKITEWLTTTVKDKNVTYCNSSVKLWLERKYNIKLIPFETYKDGLVFLVAKAIKISQIIL